MEIFGIQPSLQNNAVAGSWERLQVFLDKGWAVLPLHYPVSSNQCSCGKNDCGSIGKHPMTMHGLQDASRDKHIVQQWWKKRPRANVGILTGAKSGIVVLDVDPRHGGLESLQQWQAQFGAMPKTLTVKTGGNGLHFYFQHPGMSLSNKANILPGLDFRGDGGYIVAPPSVHKSMSAYTWEDASDPIAPLPSWLLEILQGRKAQQASLSNGASPSKTLQEGTRNSSLLSIGGILKTKGFDQAAVRVALHALAEQACTPSLPTSEIEQILSSLEKYEEDAWPEPKPLPEPTAVPELTPDMLPEALREWCLDIAERMQVPLEFTAGPAITMFASLIGRKIVLYPKRHDDWLVVPNIWGVLLALPGSMKSPAISAVLKPLANLAIKARDRYLEALRKSEADQVVAKTEIEALKDALKHAIKQGKPTQIAEKREQLAFAINEYEKKHVIKERRYMANDPTIEKLLTIMQDNPQGILLYRDELSGWMETMYKSGREGDREFFLESWNGDSSYSMDRIGRGSVFVEGLCLSVLGGLQPTKFGAYVANVAKGGKSDDGLLQRLQILLFPSRRTSWKNVDRKPNYDAEAAIERIVNTIDEIPLPERIEGSIHRMKLHFSETAQEAFDTWRLKLEMRFTMEEMSPIFEAHLSKYRSLLPSLALIFEVIDCLSKGQMIKEVGASSVQLAVRWCDLLEKHAFKAYGEYLEPAVAGARVLSAKIKSGSVRDFDRCRDLYRRGWKGLSTSDSMEDALKVLQEYGWIRTEMLNPPTGRKSEVIRLHPNLRL